MRLLGISGSLRRGSYNTQLLEEAARLAPPGAQLAIYEGLRHVPPYDPDLDDDAPPEPVDHLRRQIAEADGLLIATPEYNGSVPGPLKNAVDWASRPFPENVLRGTPVAVIGSTTGRYGAVWAQADLRKALGLAGARVLHDAELALPGAQHAFGAEGGLRSTETREQLHGILEALLHEAGLPRRAERDRDIRPAA